MRCNSKRLLGSALIVGICLVAACSVTVNTGDGDGATVDFTIAGLTFSIDLGEEGLFDITADGPDVQKTFTVSLFDETPADDPVGATLILPAERVSFVPEGSTAKATPYAQDAGQELCEMEIYLADSDVEDPCQDGAYVGTYDLAFSDGTIIMDDNDRRIADSLLGTVRTGLFNICFNIRGKSTGRLHVDGFQIRYDEETADDNENDNTSDNTNDNVDDNANDNVADNDNVIDDNANDNVDDNTNDNVADNVSDNTDDENPTDELDPDGDGLYEARACESHESVIISADDPEYKDTEGSEYCGAKIHFRNIGSHKIVVLWHARQTSPDTGEVVWDGWYSVALDGGDESSSTDRTWVYSDDGELIVNTDEVMVYRSDGDYQSGCGWLGTAIKQGDSGIDLFPVDVASLDPCR